MRKLTYLYYVLLSFCLWSCASKQNADLLITAKGIQLVSDSLQVVEAIVIKDGKVLAVGTKEELLAHFEADSSLDFKESFIYPGFIDAHCHFYGLGMFMQMVDLSGTKSIEEIVERCKQFNTLKQTATILGRGWDQNVFETKNFPNNALLNQAFPDIPVLLKRVDGHAALVNDFLLQRAGITLDSKIEGGEFLKENGKLTGVLIDNAVEVVEKYLEKPSRDLQVKALLEAQDSCLAYGLTSLTDAGLNWPLVALVDSLQSVGLLKLRLNMMLSLTQENYDWIEKKGGPIKKERLRVAGFKMYADGALGSRGACLTHPYSDRIGHHGFLLTDLPQMEAWVKRLASGDKYQLNTHAIGDSSNRILLNLYGKYLGENNSRRWRIEHAQVLQPSDFYLFKKYAVVPSVQPTHATSDMYWAKARLGSARITSAYAYKTLLNQLGWLPLGTDFPVEHISPFYTFFAAVARTDANGYPKGGFEPSNALSIEEALKGITYWAAKGAFEEKLKGTLAIGTAADFVVLPINLLQADLQQVRKLRATQTWIAGQRVH